MAAVTHFSFFPRQLLIDQYCSKNLLAIQEALSIFFEMLEGNVESKVHAFNLLFNLSVHMNLIVEHLPRLEGEGMLDAEPSPPTSDLLKSACAPCRFTARPRLTPVTIAHWVPSGPLTVRLRGRPPDAQPLQVVADDLYSKLCEMLLWMVHRRVSDASVWQAAFNCFTTFVTSFGHIDKTRLNQVDLKVFPAFLRYIPGQSETVRRHIIGMIANRLYGAGASGASGASGACVPPC